ncbi:hypothetical protein [Paraconexibacter sp. AEG42_29]
MSTDSLALTAHHRPARRQLAYGLVAAMALGSVVMWVAIPAAWVLLAAQVAHTQPTLGPLLIILIGAPLTMLPAAKLLGTLDRRHQELSGTLDERARHAPWNQSMRDSRGDDAPRSVLAVVMVTSVAIAFAALAVWFFFFAGSSLPS